MNITYKRVTQVAMAGAVSVLIGTGAHAATVGAVWDPVFGGNNGDLGWNGQAQFSLPDGCVSETNTGSGPVFVGNGDLYGVSSAACTMQLDSATVRLYDTVAGYNPNDTMTFQTVTFGPQSFTGGMKIANAGVMNAVIGIQTSHFQEFTSGAFYEGPFDMWWELSTPDPVFAQTWYDCGNEEYCTDIGQQSNPVVPSLTTCVQGTCVTVPEPGTMGLLLGGLGAGWFARRRKKTA